MDKGRLLEIKTVSADKFKLIMNVLGDPLDDAIFTIKQDKLMNEMATRTTDMSESEYNRKSSELSDSEKGYILVRCPDKSQTIFIKLQFDAQSFETFYCKPSFMNLGINFDSLNCSLDETDKGEELTLYIDEIESQKLNLMRLNPVDSELSFDTLSLIDLDDEQVQFNLNWDVKIQMNAVKFHKKVCMQLGKNSEDVMFEVIGNEFIVTTVTDNEITKKRIFPDETFYQRENGAEEAELANDKSVKIAYNPKRLNKGPIRGRYNLSNINMFKKFADLHEDMMIVLTDHVEIVDGKEIRKEMMIFKYQADIFGEILVIFSTIQDKEEDFDEYDV